MCFSVRLLVSNSLLVSENKDSQDENELYCRTCTCFSHFVFLTMFFTLGSISLLDFEYAFGYTKFLFDKVHSLQISFHD